MTRPIRYEYHRPGKDVTVYHEWLVLDRPDVKVLLLDAYDGAVLRLGETVMLDAGAPIVWYVFPGKWHDIGRFHRSDDRFTGWYTNLAKPVEMHDGVWSAHDLFLDLWLSRDGGATWLDEDEFANAVRSGVIDSATKRRILNERAIIDLQVSRGAWPPAIARDIDLTQARALKAT